MVESRSTGRLEGSNMKKGAIVVIDGTSIIAVKYCTAYRYPRGTEPVRHWGCVGDPS